MARVTPLGDGDNGEDDGDVMDVSDAEEDDKDHENDEDMEVDDDEDDESNEEDNGSKEDNRHGVKEGKKKDSCIITDPKAKEPMSVPCMKSRKNKPDWCELRAEEPPAATTAVIDAEDEHVVYFYGRTDLTRKLYQLPLYKADSWMVCNTRKDTAF